MTRGIRFFALLLLVLALCLLPHPVARAAQPAQATPHYGLPWAPGPVQDQGSSSECEGYALEAFLESAPAPRIGPGGPAIYEGGRARAPQRYPTGSIGLWMGDALDYLETQGQIAGWSRAVTSAEALQWLATQGPLLFEGPFPGPLDAAGYLPPPGTPTDGLHAWMCFAPDPTDPTGSLQCQNSWSRYWGWHNGDPWWGGRFRMHTADLGPFLALGDAQGAHIYLATKTNR